MTFRYNNVYVNNYSTIVGPYEKEGPLGDLFDRYYDDLYCDADSWEDAEVKLLKESIDLSINKYNDKKIDLIISGDLLNQISASTYACKNYNSSFIGVYTACATNVESIAIGASLIDSNKVNNCLCATSSHNMSSEKQFRNPTEYGAPKPLTSTFTATGGASIILSNKKSDIKIESATIGSIVDMEESDPLNMGAAMAGAAAKTIYEHLKDLKRDISYYDLVLTGDLGIYGKEILKEYMNKEYDIDLKNYDDCGTMLYDLDRQKDMHAGGSGPVCSALVLYTKIFKMMKEKRIKKVLMVATGALFNPDFLFQKKDIMSIANAVSLEVV